MARFAVLVSLATLSLGSSFAELLIIPPNFPLPATVLCCEPVEGSTNR